MIHVEPHCGSWLQINSIYPIYAIILSLLFVYLFIQYLLICKEATRLNDDVFSATKVPKYDYVLVINLSRNKPDLPRQSNCKLGACYKTMIYDSPENSETQTLNQTLRCRKNSAVASQRFPANLLLFAIRLYQERIMPFFLVIFSTKPSKQFQNLNVVVLCMYGTTFKFRRP